MISRWKVSSPSVLLVEVLSKNIATPVKGVSRPSSTVKTFFTGSTVSILESCFKNIISLRNKNMLQQWPLFLTIGVSLQFPAKSCLFQAHLVIHGRLVVTPGGSQKRPVWMDIRLVIYFTTLLSPSFMYACNIPLSSLNSLFRFYISRLILKAHKISSYAIGIVMSQCNHTSLFYYLWDTTLSSRAKSLGVMCSKYFFGKSKLTN